MKHEEKPRRFKLGDRVRWHSQAGGGYRTKIGTIVATVPPGVFPIDSHKDAGRTSEEWKTLERTRGGVPEGRTPRKHESYLVLADFQGGTKPRLYWPHANLLRQA